MVKEDRSPSSIVEHSVEMTIFNSRWIMAPVYVGLAATLVLLSAKFAQELLETIPTVFAVNEEHLVLSCLNLIDLSLVGNLVLMVVFAGYENFVSKIDVHDHKDKPSWMGKVDMGGLKVRMIASIVAISSIQLLKSFFNVDSYSTEHLAWMVGIHLVFVVSGVLLAFMDKLAEHKH